METEDWMKGLREPGHPSKRAPPEWHNFLMALNDLEAKAYRLSLKNTARRVAALRTAAAFERARLVAEKPRRGSEGPDPTRLAPPGA